MNYEFNYKLDEVLNEKVVAVPIIACINYFVLYFNVNVCMKAFASSKRLYKTLCEQPMKDQLAYHTTLMESKTLQYYVCIRARSKGLHIAD